MDSIDKILEERGSIYGEYIDHCKMVDKVLGFTFDRERVTRFYLASKLVRWAADMVHTDSLVDLIGYAKLRLRYGIKDFNTKAYSGNTYKDSIKRSIIEYTTKTQDNLSEQRKNDLEEMTELVLHCIESPTKVAFQQLIRSGEHILGLI